LKLSIIIPCFNEVNTIEKLLDKINTVVHFNKEIIVVDDYSSDGSRELLQNKLKNKFQKLVLNEKNFGKGYCIIQAKKVINGDIIIIQDADLEYNPDDYKHLLKPIIEGYTNVVYGSRVLGKNRYLSDNFSSVYRVFFNHVLTTLSNILNSQKLSDAHTCYKVIKKNVFDRITLKEYSFSFCPEITTKLAKINEKILEVPISYNGRSYKDGKKIKMKDGFLAIKTLFKYKFFDD
tara:strand:- start:320 stop:1021 length:702 start_codon:yes stop_codon:yes gene_type:complete